MHLSRSMMLTSMLAIYFVGVVPLKYKASVLEQVDLGELPAGQRVMRMTIGELQPGAEIGPHTHKGPGLRYVLEGAITIAWKDDRGTQTFKAGSTYFEGAGDNHPPGQMSAKNAADGMTRVLLVGVRAGASPERNGSGVFSSRSKL